MRDPSSAVASSSAKTVANDDRNCEGGKLNAAPPMPTPPWHPPSDGAKRG